MKFVLKSIFSVFIDSGLLIFLFYERIHLIMDESFLMLYYTAFYEMTHRPYILEFYIIDIFFLSFSHPSIYPHTFLFRFTTYNFITHNQIGFFMFMQKGFQLLQWYDQYIISWLVLWIQIMRSNELVISAIVISSYYGPVHFFQS